MHYRQIYMVGIGGIGMSAIARYFKHMGLDVSGYDRTPSPLTADLISEGIKIHFEEDPQMIPSDIEGTLAIYTPAIPQDSKELSWLRDKGYRLIKRAKTLGEIAKGKKCLAIAGTHGKSTTSTMLGHILQDSGTGCSAFLGGISKNYGTNLLLSDNDILVAEADEFDRSFLQLFPDTAVITAIDPDHLDIYKDLNHIREAFGEFAAQTSRNLIVKHGIDIDRMQTKARIWRYSYNTPCDFWASDITPQGNGVLEFTLNYPEGKITGCTVGIPGWVNIENAVAAGAVAILNGVAPEAVRAALKTFSGVKRRFDVHINTDRYVYIDDYAHHPKEIEAAISSIRETYPSRKITAVFQPHLYTRTRDFAAEFASALSKADEAILTDIYPARELPIEGVTSNIIFDRIECGEKSLVSREKLMEYLEDKDFDILVTFGAGDIDRFTGAITQMLNKRIAR